MDVVATGVERAMRHSIRKDERQHHSLYSMMYKVAQLHDRIAG